MKLAVYHGFIFEKTYGENDEALFIGGMDEPLALAFHGEYDKGLITVRYWVSDKEKTKIELQESVLKKYFGALDCEYGDHYSEITGYLWTDEELKLGGHDLLDELRSHIGKYIYLEIEVHEQTIEFEIKKDTQEFKRGDHILCCRTRKPIHQLHGR